MENKKQRFLTVLWVLAAATIRIIYFFFGNQSIVDTYGYYSNAMLQAEGTEPVLISGMAYAYTGNLAKLMPYFKNGPESAAIYHLILQIVWIAFIIIGMGILFGGIAQLLTGGILAFAPQILESIFVVSPENYYMFWFSLLFLALALFFGRTKKRGWYRSSFCELYLMLTGFWTGVICTWNYIGWFLLPIMIYVLAKNRYNLKDKIWEQKQKDIYLERQQVMKVGSQASILVVGQLLGMYSTLMKYTGMTGISVGEQFRWWASMYKELPGRCQDIPTYLAALVLLAGAVGILCSVLIEAVRRRKIQNEMYEDQVETDREEVKKKEPQYIVTEDGRKVELLDNPLPVPKRHEKKEMDFKLNDFNDFSEKPVIEEDAMPKTDEFDLGVLENDDFDV